MITKIKINNCFTFNKPVEINLKADMRTKRFSCNIYSVNDINIIKSAIIYGPNNTGKNAFISSVKAIKEALLNENIRLKSNIFNKSNICELGISFIHEEKNYNYEFKYDDVSYEFIYEKMSEIIYEQSGKENENIIFEKNTIDKAYQCKADKKLQNALEIISKDNILIYTLGAENFELLKTIKTILTNIAKNIEIVDMNNIPNKKTIELLKLNDATTKKVVDFIKNADLYLENYRYQEQL